ncbi:helix-turn-helix transcriptional regulator [Candidatus Woesearchaeota archaeon]|nr:helix-turn-helix transcriptional regulator [Candidatus Woesearchaeota archaeon]
MNKQCTIYNTVDFLGKRWTLLILLELYKGDSNKKRYSQLKNNIVRITPKILSLRLKELEKEKLITKKVDTTHFPITSEYQLTKSGEAFIKIIKDIKQWSIKWNMKNKECQSQDCKHCKL